MEILHLSERASREGWRVISIHLYSAPKKRDIESFASDMIAALEILHFSVLPRFVAD